jgi:hypothetical protein
MATKMATKTASEITTEAAVFDEKNGLFRFWVRTPRS